MVTHRLLYTVSNLGKHGRRAIGLREWFDDPDPVTAARVDRYIRRMEAGNFGAAKALRGGVYELRLDFGPGYRVYFGLDRKSLVILLGDGDKRGQSTGIAAAVERWERYKKAKV